MLWISWSAGRTNRFGSEEYYTIEAYIQSRDLLDKGIEILAIPLSKVIRENHVKEIYLLSIDCEGGDLDVLKSINFAENFIHIIIVEITHNKSEIEKEIIANGFQLKRNLFGNQRNGTPEIYKIFSNKLLELI